MTQRKNETREEYNARQSARNKAIYKETIARLRQYKVDQGCMDCGYNKHHAGLQFDHVIERKGNNSQLIARMAVRGYDIVMRHIEETCEVVCGTCHGIRTWERKVAALDKII